MELKLSSVRVKGNKSDKQLITIESITKCYKLSEEAVKFHYVYYKMMRKASNDEKHGKKTQNTNS